MGDSEKILQNENTSQSPGKKKKHGWMFGMLMHAVDKVFYQVYDGEPVAGNKICRQGSRENILEEEVLFCKNNVCVHDIVDMKDNEGEKRLPGYLNMKKIFRADNVVSDLMLSWVPNTLLTVGSTEEAEILSSQDSVDLTNDSAFEDQPILQESTPLRPDEILSNQNFETPLGDVFSINLIDVKTIKLFFSNPEKDSGQFVISSKENEYKVFHFHNGGLTKLSEIFQLWNGCKGDPDLNVDEVGQQVFYVVGKELIDASHDSHPEEGRYKPMNMSRWHSNANQLGQIEDGFNFRKHVFFGGLSQEVRPDAWKYLLYYYPMQSTAKDRDFAKDSKKKSYLNIQERRLSMKGDEYEEFWRNIQFTVDKDVVRTDRSHPYYAGQDNPNIDKMRNILLNYAYYNPDMGYTQGMSDLVAPLIATLHDECDSFWCFVGLMEFSMFATTPTDHSMDKSLGFLRELLRLMAPDFYMQYLCSDYELNLLFAHRWLVLCFKREFIFHEVLRIWETCWARYQTDYFHIFICVAIVSLYGNICVEKKMDSVEILQYFTDMAMKFDGAAVLVEGRSLLYKFRQLNRVPCSLRGLLSGKGVWDGGITPEIECISHNKKCCQEFAKPTSPTPSAKSKEDIATSDLEGFSDTRDNREVVTERPTVNDASNNAAVSESKQASDCKEEEGTLLSTIAQNFTNTNIIDKNDTSVTSTTTNDSELETLTSVNKTFDTNSLDTKRDAQNAQNASDEGLPTDSENTSSSSHEARGVTTSSDNTSSSTKLDDGLQEDILGDCEDVDEDEENDVYDDVVLKRVNNLSLTGEPDDEFLDTNIY